MDDLKLCPFCGRKPKFIFIRGERGHILNKAELRCDACGVVMSACGLYTENLIFNYLKEGWNRRYNDE